jgi:hypothetical protein
VESQHRAMVGAEAAAAEAEEGSEPAANATAANAAEDAAQRRRMRRRSDVAAPGGCFTVTNAAGRPKLLVIARLAPQVRGSSGFKR